MRFTVLGPVSVTVSGQEHVLLRAQARAALGFLVINSGQVVSSEMLVEALWGGAEPATSRNQVQSAMSAIRGQLRALGAAQLLASSASGYSLDLEFDQADLMVFEHAVRRARRLAGDGRVAQACQQLRAGLALWRGPVLGGCAAAYVQRARLRLSDLHLSAVETLIDHELRLGNHHAVTAEFTPLLDANPFRERLRGLLMCALYRSGRQVEALDLFHALRRDLGEGKGIDPGPELQVLAQAILRADPTLAAPPLIPMEPNVVAPRPAKAVPAQLPASVVGFTGRGDQLATLTALLANVAKQPTAVVVAGTAGVGKTALAVHWAYQVADRFPDGQLYLNLRGFEPSGSPMGPAEALRGLLDAFTVSPERIPASLGAQAATYRSLLAGKRMLVVLDNARDEDQVRPLLPGAPGCLVLITSRRQLTGLVTESAYPITVDLFSHEESHQLLSRRLGHNRLAAEPSAVQKIIARCARLPLALSIVAARAATHPDFPLATLANELRDSLCQLNVFAGDDTKTNVRTVFSWSYHTLSAEAAHLFRLLGLHPGPDLAVPAAASLIHLPTRQVRRLLAELTQAHLVTEHSPGRYALHDLLRAYAAELVHGHDSDVQRQAALCRMLDQYLRTAYTADRLLHPHREQIAVTSAQPEVIVDELADHRQALAWFTAEHPVLLAAIGQAAANGFPTHAWQLARSVRDFLDRRGHWHDAAAIQHTALDAAQRVGDQVGQAHTHRGLGFAYHRLGRVEQAHAHLRHALNLLGELGDHVGQAHIHTYISYVHDQHGEFAQALLHDEQALELFRAARNKAGQASALNGIGWDHAQLGNHTQALIYCHQALGLHKEIGNRRGEANTWDSLGYTHHHLGHHRQAIACYQRALKIFRDHGDRPNEGEALIHLGDTHHTAGNPDAAHDAWQQAFAILHELGHPDVDPVRTKLGTSHTREQQ